MSTSKLRWRASKPQNGNAPSLLELVPEIRRMVYETLLVKPYSIVGFNEVLNPHSIIEDLVILRACRQTHQEASEIFYGKNTFLVDQSPFKRVDSSGHRLSGERRRQIISQRYGHLVRHIELQTDMPVWSRQLIWSYILITCCDMIKLWPGILTIQAKLVMSNGQVTQLHEGLKEIAPLYDKGVKGLVSVLRDTCDLHDVRRIPKDIRVTSVAISPRTDLGYVIMGRSTPEAPRVYTDITELPPLINQILEQARMPRRKTRSA